jgi:hypothetical protein
MNVHAYTKTFFRKEWCLAVLMLTSRQELRSVCASIPTFQDTGKIMQLHATTFTLSRQQQ